MGYNPINGEAYAPKDIPAAAEQGHDNTQAASAASSENANPQPVAEKAANGQDQTNNANNAQKVSSFLSNGPVQLGVRGRIWVTALNCSMMISTPFTRLKRYDVDNFSVLRTVFLRTLDDYFSFQNVHTSVRVFHPPGGRSNGPLW